MFHTSGVKIAPCTSNLPVLQQLSKFWLGEVGGVGKKHRHGCSPPPKMREGVNTVGGGGGGREREQACCLLHRHTLSMRGRGGGRGTASLHGRRKPKDVGYQHYY